SVWPYVGRRRAQLPQRQVRLAMALRSKSAHYAIDNIRARHWHLLAMKNGGAAVWEAMQGLVEGVDAALHSVEARLPRQFPDRIWTPIAQGMRRQAKQFQSETGQLA